MSLVTSHIPNLINGISQQPQILRLPNQADLQENAISSVVDGLKKRSGSKFKFNAGASSSVEPLVHVIDRDSSERYHVKMLSNSIEVRDLFTGELKTVNAPKGYGYLSGTNPRTDIKLLTVNDYTFVLNTKKVVEESPIDWPLEDPSALIWVRQGGYGIKYTCNVDGVLATYTTSDTDPLTLDTTLIAQELFNQLNGNPNITVNRSGSTLSVSTTDNLDFAVSVSDGLSGNGLVLVKGKVQRFSDLPADGGSFPMTIEITGEPSSGFDNYYVQYTDSDDTGTTTGVWLETIKGGDTIGLDPDTMPWALVRESDGTFTFDDVGWQNRKVGDLGSNPLPSFVGKTISDIFFFRNRLGFVADDSVVFSKSDGEFFDFFRTTVTQVLDTDPIDYFISTDKPSYIKHAVPFNETLLFFSIKTQYQLGATAVLTPSTTSINVTTQLDCSPRVKPVGAGKFVYFGNSKGKTSELREYYVDGITETSDANDITANVPKFVPGNLSKVAASGSDSLLLALSDDSRNEVYTYKYYYAENSQKLQSAWSKWVFDQDDIILDVTFVDSEVIITTQRNGRYVVESLSVEDSIVEDGWPIDVHLDRRWNTVGLLTHPNYNPAFAAYFLPTYDPVENETTFRFPNLMSYNSEDQLQALSNGTGDIKIGVIAQIKSYSLVNMPPPLIGAFGVTQAVEVKIKNDWGGETFTWGLPFVMRYRFSEFYLRSSSGGSSPTAMTLCRLQLRKMQIQYSDSGYFKILVTPRGRDTYTYVMTGRKLGSLLNPLGEVSVQDGDFSFLIQAQNTQAEIEIVNDSFLPSNILSGEWEGFFTQRSRRV